VSGAARREGTAPTRRDEVLEAAAAVFVERGFDAATTRDIGERAGVLSGSLYHHFETKEEMLFELVRDVYDGVLATLDGLDPTSGTAADRLRLVLENHVRHLIANLARTTLFLHEFRSLTEEHRAIVQAAEERYVGVVTGLVEEGRADGSLRGDVDPRLARMVLLGAVNWVYRWYREGGSWPPEKIATDIASILLDGMSTRPTS
jgi:AcrR family transcriptional regulator